MSKPDDHQIVAAHRYMARFAKNVGFDCIDTLILQFVGFDLYSPHWITLSGAEEFRRHYLVITGEGTHEESN
jgi:hypothetical protein